MQPQILANAPRCGARTRSGAPCRSPAVHGNRRCRMHGGKGSGAPRGNRNAWKHGLRSASHIAWKRSVVLYLRATEHVLRAAHLLFRTHRACEKLKIPTGNPMHPDIAAPAPGISGVGNGVQRLRPAPGPMRENKKTDTQPHAPGKRGEIEARSTPPGRLSHPSSAPYFPLPRREWLGVGDGAKGLDAPWRSSGQRSRALATLATHPSDACSRSGLPPAIPKPCRGHDLPRTMHHSSLRGRGEECQAQRKLGPPPNILDLRIAASKAICPPWHPCSIPKRVGASSSSAPARAIPVC